MKRFVFLSIMALLFLAACNTTYVTSSWKAKDAALRSYDKVLVIGLMGDTNRLLRQSLEKELASDLQKKGINAVSAYEEYGPKVFVKMSEEQMNNVIKKKGFDGVITISLLNKKKERYYVPQHMYYTPYYVYGYPYFWGYYSVMYDRTYSPDYYYEEDVHYFWESNLYDLGTGKLVYSAQSRSFNPQSADKLANDYGKMLVRDLVQNGIVMKK